MSDDRSERITDGAIEVAPEWINGQTPSVPGGLNLDGKKAKRSRRTKAQIQADRAGSLPIESRTKESTTDVQYDKGYKFSLATEVMPAPVRRKRFLATIEPMIVFGFYLDRKERSFVMYLGCFGFCINF